MKVERGSQIKEGKAKILYETQPVGDCIVQHFKDDATAFNALKKGQIRNKGAINNTITSWIFPYLEKQGVATHFVEQLSEREMLVKKVDIIPVEVVIRNRAAGSICKRLGLAKGESFKTPLIEYFYKSDELGDPLIGETHIAYFQWATPSELNQMKEKAFKVNAALQYVFSEIGLELVDFKIEFGRHATGVLLADEFSPDGSRLWDLKTGESMDKDRFRQDLGRVDETYEEVYQRLQKFFERK